MKTGNFYDHKFSDISEIELGKNNSTAIYVEVDIKLNRPYKVISFDLESKKETVLFSESDPSRYVNLQITKDGKYLLINSATKEDNEIWMVPMEGKDFDTKLLFERDNGVRAHIDHLRDFFIMITNKSVSSKDFKLMKCKDKETTWEDLLPESEN